MNRNHSKDKAFIPRWKRRLRLYYLRMMRVQGQPSKVAGGMAIGVSIGFTPTIPLHTLLAVCLAFLLRKSKLAAALGVWVANPFVFPFIYLVDYKLGLLITGTAGPSLDFAEASASSILELGWDIAYPLLVGGALVALVSVFPTYFLTKRAVLIYRARKRKRMQELGLTSQAT